MFGKRGQLTVFVIIGIVILSSFALLWLTAASVKEKTTPVFKAQKGDVAGYVQACLADALLGGIKKYGLNEPALAGHLNSRIEECSLDVFKKQGMEIEKGRISAGVTVGDAAVIATLHYPITIKLAETTEKLTNFIYTLPRTSAAIPRSENNVVTEDFVLATRDNSVQVEIQKGTEIPADVAEKGVSVTIVKSTQTQIPVSFHLGPDGAEFSPPMKITLRYDDSRIVVPEETLQVAVKDKETGWIALPTEVNPAENTVTAYVSHFSEFGITAGKCQEIVLAKAGEALTGKDIKIPESCKNQVCWVYSPCGDITPYVQINDRAAILGQFFTIGQGDHENSGPMGLTVGPQSAPTVITDHLWSRNKIEIFRAFPCTRIDKNRNMPASITLRGGFFLTTSMADGDHWYWGPTEKKVYQAWPGQWGTASSDIKMYVCPGETIVVEPVCISESSTEYGKCADKKDNDCDGKIDCTDSDCSNAPGCQ